MNCAQCGAPIAEGSTSCPHCKSSARPTLVGDKGAMAGRRIVIDAPIRVGRSQQNNELVIDDNEVSRWHARLEPSGRAVRLIDLDSANGTFVDGERIKERLLTGGERIRFGLREENSFRFDCPPAERPHEESSAPPAKRSSQTIMMGADELEGGPRRRLQLILDQYAVRDFPLKNGRIAIGRAPGEGGVAIQHPSLADRQAELVVTPQQAILKDLGSRTGVFVNGEKIVERILLEGDLLRFGACESHLWLYRESRQRVAPLREVELKASVTTIGRGEQNALKLDHPTVSTRHAEIRKTSEGFELVDLGSTNGTYVNGQRISRCKLSPRDKISLGAVQFVFDGAQMAQSSDGQHVRLLARELRVEAKDFTTGEPIRLLDDVSMVFEPCEFIGLLGPSGAGKSTLMDALNGSRPAQHGSVKLNASDLYSEFDSLRAQIGYLPQDDILHKELTVRECLRYSARLRLPDDFGERETEQRVEEVIRLLELGERADIKIAQLSGGQRKRVSLGIELLSKPAILFVDEPTAGQDPRTEMKMMQLFREIANRGSTVVINTHLLGSFSLLDKVAVLVRGKLAYYGGSQEMLPYFDAARPTEIYDTLQQKKPEEWAAQFKQSEVYRENIADKLAGASAEGGKKGAVKPAHRSCLRQMMTLLGRQFTLKMKDKAALAALLAPPAIIALLMGVMSCEPNAMMTIFMIVLVSLWFGCSACVREIVDELPVYRRERQRELELSSYLGAKVIYLLLAALAQTIPFVAVLAAMGAVDGHLPELTLLAWVMSVEGGLIGLLISAFFNTAEKALYAFPLMMIPQLLLGGMLMPNAPLHPFKPEFNVQARTVSVSDLPTDLTPAPLPPAISNTLSPLMVSRWGLEGLTDLYIHDIAEATPSDSKRYAFQAMNMVSITLHPDDAQQTRAALQQMNEDLQQGRPAHAAPAVDSAFWRYMGILGGFAVAMLAAIAATLKAKR